MATANNAQKIAGLYAAFFERAPDAAGLAYWEEKFTDSATVADLAVEFAAHPVFQDTYGDMTDVQFVQAIYQNVLGAPGDADGIDYWVSFLKAGGENVRAEFVAQFVNDALTVDLSEFTDLTAEELAVAQQRQDTLTNKVEAGLYFTEKFGAASNITADDITQDPAYLAAQAAISNVTADPASVAAAKGRVDVAVQTDDPADSLIGQNSALTAALVDLQGKQAAEADASVALAALVTPNWNNLTAEQKNAAVQALDPVEARNDAETAVADAKLASAQANNVLTRARAEESDAELKADVAEALAEVNGNAEAKALLTTVNSANAKVAAGSDLAVLTALKTALANFVDAGGLVDASVGNGKIVAELINDVNEALNEKDVASTPANEAEVALAAEVDGYVAAKYELDTVGTTPTAAEKALQDAINAVVARDQAKIDQAAAEEAFSGNGLGAALRGAEGELAERDALIKASSDAAANVTKAEANLNAVQKAYDALVAAGEAVEAAELVIEELGVNLVTGDTATAEDDLFVADLGTDAEINGFAAGDQLYIGTQFKFGGDDVAANAADLFEAGDESALEVFFVQNGTTAEVHIEEKAFANAGSGAVAGTDITVIELTGVNVDALSFDNGFVSFA